MASKHAHHVAPQFYLRRFADEDKMLRQTAKLDGHSMVVPAKHATVIHDLYTIDAKDGGELDRFEDVLGRIESDAARSISAILDQGKWPLDDAARQRLALWISAQYLRTPRNRAFLEASMNDHRSAIGGWAIEKVRAAVAGRGWSDEEISSKWAETLNYYSADGPQPRNAHVGWFQGLVFDAARNVFMRPWQLVTFSEPALLTSDCLVTPIREEGMLAPGLHLFPAPLVHVALDRQNLLVLHLPKESLKDGDDGRRPGDPGFATMVNVMAAAHADVSTFEHPEDQIRSNLPSWCE